MASSLVWYDGRWYDEQPKILGPLDHAFWMASVVFDGARAFQRMAPDLDRHCERLIISAEALMLRSPLAAEEVAALCEEAVRRLPADAELYIRPIVFATRGFVVPDKDSSEFILAVHALPMPEPTGMAVCFSRFRRPARDAAPTDAKASCLYPNMQRALAEANAAGFDNAITFDPSGNVAELCTANLWIANDGIAKTPVCNGTFLNGITRQRVMGLLGEAGVPVSECTLTKDDILSADEVFTTGNYGKVLPITRVEHRELQPGPVYRKARELYFEFAATKRVT
jgi:branched-chain amino acid aminotransferase